MQLVGVGLTNWLGWCMKERPLACELHLFNDSETIAERWLSIAFGLLVIVSISVLLADIMHVSSNQRWNVEIGEQVAHVPRGRKLANELKWVAVLHWPPPIGPSAP